MSDKISEKTIAKLKSDIERIKRSNIAENKRLDDLFDFVEFSKDLLPEPDLEYARFHQLKYVNAPLPPMFIWFGKKYSASWSDDNIEISPEDYNETTKLQFVNKLKEWLAYGREPLVA